MNRALLSLHGKSIETTITVPLKREDARNWLLLNLRKAQMLIANLPNPRWYCWLQMKSWLVFPENTLRGNFVKVNLLKGKNHSVRNWVIATNFDFLNPISMQPYVAKWGIFWIRGGGDWFLGTILLLNAYAVIFIIKMDNFDVFCNIFISKHCISCSLNFFYNDFNL